MAVGASAILFLTWRLPIVIGSKRFSKWVIIVPLYPFKALNFFGNYPDGPTSIGLLTFIQGGSPSLAMNNHYINVEIF